MERKKLGDIINELKGCKFELIYNKQVLPTDYLGWPFEEDMDREVLGIKSLVRDTQLETFLDCAIFVGEKI